MLKSSLKIILKVLTNRLALKLNQLIENYQIGIAGRIVLEGLCNSL